LSKRVKACAAQCHAKGHQFESHHSPFGYFENTKYQLNPSETDIVAVTPPRLDELHLSPFAHRFEDLICLIFNLRPMPLWRITAS